MKTELERCRGLSDVELLDTLRRNPLAPLIPALTALLERIEIKPEPGTKEPT